MQISGKTAILMKSVETADSGKRRDMPMNIQTGVRSAEHEENRAEENTVRERERERENYNY